MIPEHVIVPRAPDKNKMPSIMPLITKLVLTTNTLWVLTTCLTKTALLLQYLRLFPNPAPSPLALNLRRLTQFLLLVLIPTTFWGLFGGLFICKPIQKIWVHDVPGHCDNPETYWLSVAALDVLLDFFIWGMPIPMVLGLQSITRREKIGLVSVFALGFSVCIIGLSRLIVVHLTAREKAWTSSAIDAIVWSAVEMNVGLVCAGVVALKPLAVKVKNRLSVSNLPETYPEKDEGDTGNKTGKSHAGSGSTLVASTRNDSPMISRKSKSSCRGRLDSTEDRKQLPPLLSTSYHMLSSGAQPVTDEVCPLSPTSGSFVAHDFAYGNHKKASSQPESHSRVQKARQSSERTRSWSDIMLQPFRFKSISSTRQDGLEDASPWPTCNSKTIAGDGALSQLTPLNSHPRLTTVSEGSSATTQPPVLPPPIPGLCHDEFHELTAPISSITSRDSIAIHHARLAADRANAYPLIARDSISFHHARIAARISPKVARDSIGFHHARLATSRWSGSSENKDRQSPEPDFQTRRLSSLRSSSIDSLTSDSEEVEPSVYQHITTPATIRSTRSSVAEPRHKPVTRSSSRSHNLYGEEFCGPGLGIFVDGDLESSIGEALSGCAVPLPTIPDSEEIGRAF